MVTLGKLRIDGNLKSIRDRALFVPLVPSQDSH